MKTFIRICLVITIASLSFGAFAEDIDNQNVTTIETPALSCKYKVVKQWKRGFKTYIYLKNETTETISDWEINFTFNESQMIRRYWSSAVEQSDQDVSITPVYWNREIAAGRSVRIGFVARSTGRNTVPDLGGVCAGKKVVEEVPLELPFEISEGQSVLFDSNNLLTFHTVLEDTYCPWGYGDGYEGQVKILLETVVSGVSTMVDLGSYEKPSMRVGDYILNFEAITYFGWYNSPYKVEMSIAKPLPKVVDLALPFDIELGETVVFEDSNTLRFSSIVNDSRCMDEDLDCPAEEEVSAEMILTIDGATTTFAVSTVTAPSFKQDPYSLLVNELVSAPSTSADSGDYYTAPEKFTPYVLNVTLNKKQPPQKVAISGEGNVRLISGDVAVFAIEIDNGQMYIPENLPRNLGIDGLRVRFDGFVLPEAPSPVEGAVILELTDIAEIAQTQIPVVGGAGTIELVNGLFFGIRSLDDGEIYFPANLSRDFGMPGLAVEFQARVSVGVDSPAGVGVAVELLSINRR